MAFKVYCSTCDIPLCLQDGGKPGHGLPSAKAHAKAHKQTPEQFERALLSAAKAGTLIWSKIK